MNRIETSFETKILTGTSSYTSKSRGNNGNHLYLRVAIKRWRKNTELLGIVENMNVGNKTMTNDPDLTVESSSSASNSTALKHESKTPLSSQVTGRGESIRLK